VTTSHTMHAVLTLSLFCCPAVTSTYEYEYSHRSDDSVSMLQSSIQVKHQPLLLSDRATSTIATVEAGRAVARASPKCSCNEQVDGSVKVIFINMNDSADRCVAISAHLEKMGIPFARFPATAITQNDDGTFLPADVHELKHAFSSWSCGLWTYPDPNDFLCCTGLDGAMGYTAHRNAHGSSGDSGEDQAPSSNYLGNLASHVKVFSTLQKKRQSFGSRNWVVVAEDDARFVSANWEKQVAVAIELAGAWDVIKLYEGYMTTPLTYTAVMNTTQYAGTGCNKHCDALGHCILHVSNLRQVWTNVALLMNLDKPEKVQRGLESTFKEIRESIFWPSSQRFSLDWLLQVAAWDGRLNVIVSLPQSVVADKGFDKESTLSK